MVTHKGDSTYHLIPSLFDFHRTNNWDMEYLISRPCAVRLNMQCMADNCPACAGWSGIERFLLFACLSGKQ